MKLVLFALLLWIQCCRGSLEAADVIHIGVSVTTQGPTVFVTGGAATLFVPNSFFS